MPLPSLSKLKVAVKPLSQLRANRYQLLRDSIGDAQVVLIGEATHGTKEFYEERAAITKALIQEDGFSFVALEADFPDALTINRFVSTDPKNDLNKPQTAEEALGDFDRFPKWMWRNDVVLEFASWLKGYNEEQSKQGQRKAADVSIYGLDLYSLNRSSHEVIKYLDSVDEDAGNLARKRYAVLQMFHEHIQEYGMAVMHRLVKSQKENCVKILVDLLKHGPRYCDQHTNGDELLYGTENARLVRDAEAYYRAMFTTDESTWDLRDTHMANSLQSLMRHHNKSKANEAASGGGDKEEKKPSPTRTRCVVWAHNSHIGDARARLGARDETNIGEIIRKRVGLDNTFTIGFTTYNGKVSAATRWDGTRQTMELNDALPGSYEELFHNVSLDLASDDPDFGIIMRSNRPEGSQQPHVPALEVLRTPRLERFVGVQYVKRTELQSHYQQYCLPDQFDAVLHIDRTSALHAMDPDE